MHAVDKKRVPERDKDRSMKGSDIELGSFPVIPGVTWVEPISMLCQTNNNKSYSERFRT